MVEAVVRRTEDKESQYDTGYPTIDWIRYIQPVQIHFLLLWKCNSRYKDSDRDITTP